MRVFEVGFIESGSDGLLVVRKFLANNFSSVLKRAEKEIAIIAKSEVIAEIDYIKGLFDIDA